MEYLIDIFPKDIVNIIIRYKTDLVFSDVMDDLLANTRRCDCCCDHGDTWTHNLACTNYTWIYHSGLLICFTRKTSYPFLEEDIDFFYCKFSKSCAKMFRRTIYEEM